MLQVWRSESGQAKQMVCVSWLTSHCSSAQSPSLALAAALVPDNSEFRRIRDYGSAAQEQIKAVHVTSLLGYRQASPVPMFGHISYSLSKCYLLLLCQ